MLSKILVCAASLAVASLANADTLTDTALNVTYTATSTFVPVSGNTYDVNLTINPTGFSQGSGYLTAVAMQFETGSDIASSVTLLSAPGGTDAWSLEDVGGLNSKGCDFKGGNSGDVCFQNLSANTAVPGGPYSFTFAVTMPGNDALTAASDIKAAYNMARDNSGTNLGLTSQSITIHHAEAPEPATVALLGAGLIGIGFLRRRIGRNRAA